MIRRYVLATAAVVLLVVGLLLGLTVYLGLHYGETSDDRARIGTLAEALTPAADGLQFDPTQTPAQWMQGYAWAMVLDEDGTVIGQYDLPQNLNKHYTASEIASFSRWYLDDWPVFCWTADYGLFVAAQPRGSVWKYNIYSSAALMYAAAAGLLPTLGVLLAAVVGCCVFSAGGGRGSYGPLRQGWTPLPTAARWNYPPPAMRASWPMRSTAPVSSCAAARKSLPGGTTRGRTGSPGSAMMCAHRWR